ncbi:carboxypeptidase M32 [Schinkia azotoformans]|uniref:Metal-dependent carboxypeptidase n=1 Tax=Schinkia azotoformans LMG 9581 TaxID=1131731 RepID=K6D302_SCHAZ|nr:carboxypeptidase M32 [Schinkia azotoformans]EKN66877.1 Carboxypeptidase Taq (M32) metallopeptidase [Schinkia azotoformans LMG 9581]MEC1639522.1 carboxypeptidase M32 [Schinkia azotoformans]MEC1944224.1 carboxypeptidase M32 [Schinkia azotoformans]
MEQSIQKAESEFLEYVKKMSAYNEALSLIFWDMRTGAPKKGIEQRSEVVGMISQEVFQMSVSEEMKNYIDTLEKVKDLSEITKKTVEECKKDYEHNTKIPKEEYKEYVILQSKAESVWEEAKEKADFEMFRPYLEKLVEFNKKFIGYWGPPKEGGNKYDILLDQYEPGVTVAILDETFGKLREKIVPLVRKISESQNQPKTDFLFKTFPKAEQKAFSIDVLKQMGYDFEAGRLDETVHPFEITLNPGDVRVTTKYVENDFRVAVFGTIHEGGHALYEQNISKDLIGTPLCEGTSMGIHESQSLFWENYIARDYNFWVYFYEKLKAYSNGQFDNVAIDDFYKGINESKPSLIRIEADELTYPLHVMVRYEIEKGLFNDEIEVKDLPVIWNQKMEEYLGVTPKHDGEGVLQDVHWAGGSFGYFPSYALGYIYAAQFRAALLKDLPNLGDLLKAGNLVLIKEWLAENIHQYGKIKKPLEIVKDVTGEGLNSNYLIQYLEEKYAKIYDL